MTPCFLPKTQKQPTEMSYKKGVLKNFAKFIRKHLRKTLFFNKGARSGLQLYYKRDSSTGIFL